MLITAGYLALVIAWVAGYRSLQMRFYRLKPEFLTMAAGWIKLQTGQRTSMAGTCFSGEDWISILMDAAGKDYLNVKISFADHAFSCEERPAYNKTAADDALALTLAFMKNS
jgi:hypothetical protein